ncbi:uncharacterized protein LOC100076770 [Ornithorhynchus anatinus]|uniref:Ig-like domain-containing protein n=1 Tax=Ornithorhynchus anatinus TaxID=9258 RepID=F6SWN2_ORNAN|nr:uncharacterized protein LOC100076770 [Ornithorhynchus anatinus]
METGHVYNFSLPVGQRAPEVYPLYAGCGSPAPAEDKVTLVCLATNFSPNDLAFTWNIKDDVKNFPSVRRSDMTYIESSQLTFPASKWDSETPTCTVKHNQQKEKKIIVFKRQDQRMQPPRVHLLPPPCVGTSEGGTVELICLLLQFKPNSTEVQWLLNGRELNKPAPTLFAADQDGSFMARSLLRISSSNWEGGDTFTCRVTHPALKEGPELYNSSKCSACHSHATAMTLYLFAPSYDELVRGNGKGHATCLVLGYDLASVQISWQVNGVVTEGQTGVTRHESNGTESRTSTQTISLADWKAGRRYICRAKHPCVKEVTQELSTFDPKTPTKKPSVSVSRVFSEDSPGEEDHPTLLCNIRGFYPKELSVSWENNSHPLPRTLYSSGPVVATGNEAFSTYSLLRVGPGERGGAYTCVVMHPSTDRPTRSNKVSFDWALSRAPEVSITGHPACNAPGAETSVFRCSASNFFPAGAEILWLVKGQEQPGLTQTITRSRDGRYSASLELSVPNAQWNQLAEFTCRVSHAGATQQKNLSKCAVCQDSTPQPTLYLLPPPLEGLVLRAEALLTCLVVGYQLDQATLTWEVDKKPLAGSPSVRALVTHDNGTQSLRSHLNLSRTDWEAAHTVLCRVSHRCLFAPQEETLQPLRGADPPRKLSIHVLHPSLPQSSAEASAWLLCEVSNFSPAEIFLTWWENETSVSPSWFTTTAPFAQPGNAMYSTQSLLRIPASQGHMASTYTCMVGHVSSPSMLNISRNGVFDFLEPARPLVTAFHEPSGSSREKLVCLATDFRPKDIDMKWEVRGQERRCSDSLPSKALGNGMFQQSCALLLSLEEWTQPETYTCVVNHSSDTAAVRRELTSTQCPAWSPTAHTLPPSFEWLLQNETVVLTCVTDMFNASVEWTAGEELAALETVENKKEKFPNGSSWLFSQLKVNFSVWNSTESFSCQVKDGQSELRVNVTHIPGPVKAPKVYLFPPPTEEMSRGPSLTLVCLIKDFYPASILVQWQEGSAVLETQAAQSQNPSCDHQSRRCSAVSKLEIPKSRWMARTRYHCQVFHISRRGILIRNASTHYDPRVIDFTFKDENNDDYTEMDESNNVWPTVSTFVALFLLTLLYSGFVTFIKVK